MRVSLTQVQTFYWVARLRSFHAAARHQHVTQPTISARIRELEGIVGYRLFERHAQGVELTPKGSAFLKKSMKLLDASDDLLAEETAPMHGLLRLGSNESAALTGLADFLHRLRGHYPTLRVELTIDVGSTLRERLSSGGVDFAISTDPSTHPHIRNVLLGAQQMSWIAAPGKFPPHARLSAADIATTLILTVPAPSALHAIVTNWFAGAQISPPQMNFCNSLAVLLELVAAGIAVAVLPTALVQRKLHDGQIQILEAEHPVPPLHIYASFPLVGDIRTSENVVALARQSLTDSGLIQPRP